MSSPNTAQPVSVHGHEVIRIIAEADPPLTALALATEVRRRFGANVRFHTCSVEGMTLNQLLGLLQRLGKLHQLPGGVLCMDMSKVCGGEGHEGHEH